MIEYTYDEAVEYLLGIPKFAEKIGHENLLNYLDLLEHPEKRIATVHVAGTNGKGSVCAGLSAILRDAGLKVGVFTSPHLVKMNERFSINGEEISNEEFLSVFRLVLSRVERGMGKGLDHPSFFEFIFIMGMVWFAIEGVDLAIVETGLGGRLDATNVLSPMLTVITSVGKDHMQYLGDTIEQIAAEKAGIIKPGIPCIYLDKNPSVSAVIEEKARELKAKSIKICASDIQILGCDNGLKFVYDNPLDREFHGGDCTYTIPATATYQCENAMLACYAGYIVLDQIARILSQNTKQSEGNGGVSSEDCLIPSIRPELIQNGEVSYPEIAETVHRGIRNFYIPGRMEEIEPNVFLDGAHNEPGIRAFVDSWKALHSGRKLTLLFAVAKDKRYNEMISMLREIPGLERVILTKIPGDRQVVPETLLPLFSGVDTQCVPDLAEAYEKAKGYADDEHAVCCVGSLYLIGAVRALFA